MADFRSLVDQVPPVTRFLLAATAAVTFPTLLGIISSKNVYLDWTRATYGLQIWRPVTAFFQGGSGFPLIYDFFLIYRNSSALETGTYFGNTPAYAFATLCTSIFILALNTILPRVPFLPFSSLPFLFRPFLHAQNYAWCRANPTMKISLFGLLSIPVPYYPAALIVLDLITGGPDKALGGVVGLLSGHLWWFISTYLPTHPNPSYRKSNPLTTPQWFISLFPHSMRSSFSSSSFSGSSARGFSRQAGGNFADRSAAAAAAEGRSSAVRGGTAGSGSSAGHRWGGGGNRLGGTPL